MSIRVTCPLCGASGQAPAELAGKKVKCKRCAGPIPVPAKAAKPAAPAPPAKPMDPRLAKLLVGGPLGWLAVGGLLAVAAPWLNALGEAVALPVRLLVLIITLACIVWNNYHAVRVLGRTGTMRSVVTLALVQLGLFALLFFQIAGHVGAANYLWEDPVHWWDWLRYVAAHLVQAADLLDVIQGFGITMDTIHNRGPLTAVCLFLFHLTFGLFFLGLAVEWIEPFTRNLFRQLIGWWIAAFIVFLLAWIVTAEFFRPWQRGDMPLWLLDNFLRVVDVPDLMEILHVRLHRVSPNWWEGTLAFLCRLFFGLTLLSVLSHVWLRLRIRKWHGFGVSRETLEEQIEVYSKAVLRTDAERLLETRSARPVPQRGPWEKLPLRPALIVGFLGICLGLLPTCAVGFWSGPAQSLAASALTEQQAAHALAGLQRLGPYAESAVPILAEKLTTLDRDQHQPKVLETMAHLGPAGREQLGHYLLGGDPDLAVLAVWALEQGGGQGAPQLARGPFALFAEVRGKADTTLAKLGEDACDPLLRDLTPENAWIVFPWLNKLDPLWTKRACRNPHFADVCQIKDLVAVVVDYESDGLAQHRTGEELMRIGRPLALPAMPALQDRLAKGPTRVEALTPEGPVDGAKTLRQATQKLMPYPSSAVLVLRNAAEKLPQPPLPRELCQQIDGGDPTTLVKFLKDPQAKPALAAFEKMLADDDAEILTLAFTSLKDSGVWQPAAKTLIPLVRKPLPPVQLPAIGLLAGMGKGAAPAVSVLTDTLKDKNLAFRIAAIHALGQIGPAAKQAIPALKALTTDADVGKHALSALTLIEPKGKTLP